MAQKDDLEAVRLVADALEGFEAKDQERIIRWARERIGLSVAPVSPSGPPSSEAPPVPGSATPATTAKDLKTFVAEKKPKNDVQFAATVAYYHRFEAPEKLRKGGINTDDVPENCSPV